MVGWNDVRTGLDAVGFARRRLGFEPDELQAQIFRSRSKRLLLNCSRQWGKSSVCAIAALYRAWFRPGSLVVIAGPSGRQTAEFVDKVREFASRLDIKPRGDGRNKSLVLPNKSRIVGVPSTQKTVRCFSGASMLVFDEAAYASDRLYLAMRPVLAASGGDLWCLSTPNGKSGFFWEAWAKGGAAWTRVMAPATECARISKEFLEEERRTHPDNWFRQEYMGKFVQDSEGLFDMELVDKAFEDYE